jgi:hypothetical protein
MKQKILYAFIMAFCLSLFSLAGQKKENCLKHFCCCDAKNKTNSKAKSAGFDLSPLNFLYLGFD